jgi:hypothetical protein
MQSHRAIVIFPGHMIERTDFDHSGIVDQNVDSIEVVDDLLNSQTNLIAIEQIAFDSHYCSATRSEISLRARKFFRITREQSNLAAFVANVPRQHKPQSARSATNQGNLIAQLVLRRANETDNYPTTQ